MKIDLQKIESRLREFFEEDLQIVSHQNPLQNVTNEMISVLEKNLKESGDKIFAPNIFRIYFHDHGWISENEIEEWKNYVQEIIKDIIRDNSFQLAGPLHIQVFHNPRLEGEYEIAVSNSSLPSGKTVAFFSENEAQKDNASNVTGYLITSDEDYFKLVKSITSIGRREDNDLVIENLRVSRVHAQIKQMNNKHIIFDLDSTAGTKVNGVKIRQHTLNHGDVIEIADVPLIYGTELDQPQTEENLNKTKMLASKKLPKERQ